MLVVWGIFVCSRFFLDTLNKMPSEENFSCRPKDIGPVSHKVIDTFKEGVSLLNAIQNFENLCPHRSTYDPHIHILWRNEKIIPIMQQFILVHHVISR